jgi:hypothetical protein
MAPLPLKRWCRYTASQPATGGQVIRVRWCNSREAAVLVAAPRRVPPARSEPPATRFRSFGSGQHPTRPKITRTACPIPTELAGSVLGARLSGPRPAHDVTQTRTGGFTLQHGTGQRGGPGG